MKLWMIFPLLLFEWSIYAVSNVQKIKKDHDSDTSIIVKLSDTAAIYRETALWSDPGAYMIVRSAPSGKVFCKQPLILASECELFLGQDVRIGRNKLLVTINSADQKEQFAKWVNLDVGGIYDRTYDPEFYHFRHLKRMKNILLGTLRSSRFQKIAVGIGMGLAAAKGGIIATKLLKGKRHHLNMTPHVQVKSSSARASESVGSGSYWEGGLYGIIWALGVAGLVIGAVRKSANEGGARTTPPVRLR